MKRKSQRRNLNKKYQSIDHNAQEKEEKKRAKKSRESKESKVKVTKMEMLQEQNMNNISANSEFETDRSRAGGSKETFEEKI